VLNPKSLTLPASGPEGAPSRPGNYTRAYRKRAVLLVVCCAVAAAADDPKEIVRHALEFHTQNDEIARSYTFVRRQETRTLDTSGVVKHRESRTFDVTLLEGSPYSRLIQRDDKPLSPNEEKQQREDLEKNNALRRKETLEERQERVAAWERSRQRQQDQLKEAPDAFDFRLVGEAQVDGVPVWVIEGTPHPGFQPKSRAAAFFTKVKGRIWVAKADYQPVKMEAESLDTISIGAFLLRLAKGAHINIEYARVNDEVWLPKHIGLTGAARILVVKGLHVENDTDYSHYQRFVVSSRLAGEVSGPRP
jgi:hypothetical protein